ncbi:tetratricopeptide repeat protein [Methylobacterium sp. BTF04]|uniref:tetratricopeptide repeat protein n=1 Tax=Methylobacterium sp. BTF04 TaxID=2708300 RepID=UPI0013D601E3|nr:tetratricopeptide repeat protein [Methylobacterium sp. BTF04]NEU12968.1 tetratricopeptide repeat protein [Methylobacterium sp. BTF04]
MARRMDQRRAPSTAKILQQAAADEQGGRFADAERRYRRLVEAEPQHAQGHYKLGILVSQTGRDHLAVPHFAAALKADPGEPRYWLALATALLGAGRLPDARSILQRFAEKRFSDAATKATLTALVANLFTEAHQHFQGGKLTEAEALIDVIVLLDAGHAEAIHLAGNIASMTNRLDLAFDLLSIAVSLDDSSAGFHANLGNVLSHQKRYDESAVCYERALERDPLSFVAHSNLGVVLQKQGLLQQAVGHLGEALRLAPDYAKAHNNLGVVLKDLGRLDEAVACYDTALSLDPTTPLVHSNRIFARMYATDSSALAQLADAKSFGARFADPLLRQRPFANDRDPDRRLRIGFVSGDFCEHAVNYFFEPALRHFERAQIETFAYSNTVREDAVTERLKSVFAQWRCLCGLDDDAAADLIEADAIDILVDLSGHTAQNRLLVFARKPAPIQVAWIGFPGTTGMAAMDYRFTDPHAEPLGLGDDFSVEALWRLSRVSACYQAPAKHLPLSDHPPAETNGYVTFGCFNRFTKMSDATLAAWGRILHRVSDARLLLEIANVEDPEVHADVAARLERVGIPLDRTLLEPRAPANRYVLYNRIDIALDPFPYNGGTTSLDTLYMGVPFIALAGTHYVARMGHSMLTNVGLPELSAATVEDYIDRASDLANDWERLNTLRHGLRERMIASPLMDHAGLADDIGAAFRAMWRRWVETTETGRP